MPMAANVTVVNDLNSIYFSAKVKAAFLAIFIPPHTINKLASKRLPDNKFAVKVPDTYISTIAKHMKIGSLG